MKPNRCPNCHTDLSLFISPRGAARMLQALHAMTLDGNAEEIPPEVAGEITIGPAELHDTAEALRDEDPSSLDIAEREALREGGEITVNSYGVMLIHTPQCTLPNHGVDLRTGIYIA